MISIKTLTNGKSAAYVGGGNFFTQAKPTNFHQFWTQKILLENETVADFKEVTAAERSAIETADAEWTRPPQSFIDLWNNACIDPLTKRAVGQYNESTGYFELNGINDLTYEEALEILLMSGDWGCDSNDYSRKFATINCRTIFPIKATGQSFIDDLAYKSPNLEVIAFASGLTIKSLNCYSAFYGCKRLKKIEGEIKANLDVRFFNIFDGCEKLEDVTMRHIHQNISFKDSPLLSIGSLTYLVTYRQDSNPITVTVHADVFAKLTGDTTNPAVAALTPSELAQWQQILTAATAKNISFTTP